MTQTSLTTASETSDCVEAPVGLLAELTHRCPLQCPYCSNPLELERASAELPTSAWLNAFAQAADLGVLQLHLSGGEPTVRRDLELLVAGAARVGLYTNLITSAVLLTRTRLEALAANGLDHVQISLQDTAIENADRLAGIRRAHSKKLEVAGWVRNLGLPLTINAPVHRQNVDRVEDMVHLAVELGASRLEIAHVQYYGWALRNRAALMPTREQIKRSIAVVEGARERFRGILTIDFVTPDYYASRPKPCMGGWGRGMITIAPSGDMLPCHAARTISELTFDNITQVSLENIWLHSMAFTKFRGTDWMREPCRSCSFREIDFGGCRCQALALTGDAGQTDPACAKSSRHFELTALAEAEAASGQVEFAYRQFSPLAVGGRSSEAENFTAK